MSVLLWAQSVWHWSALHAGLAFVPGPLVVLLLSRRSAALPQRLGSGATAALGCSVFATAGLLSYLAETPRPHYLAVLLPVVLLMGFGVLLTLPTLMTAATASLPPERLATGSAAISMARQLGFTLGVAVFVAVVDPSRHRSGQLAAFRHGWLAIALTATLAACASLALVQRRSRADELCEPAFELAR
jgi:hypothetical protein